jgi:hypothetical protein
MSFKIKTKEGVALMSKQLNDDAKKIYKYEGDGLAHPPGKDNINHRWDLFIGNEIMRPSLNLNYETMNWKFLKNSLCARYLKDIHTYPIDSKEEENQHGYLDYIHNHLKPHFELINYWQEQGYTIHVI